MTPTPPLDTGRLIELRELLASQTWAADWPHNIVPPSKPAQELACMAIRALPSLLTVLDTDRVRLEEAERVIAPFAKAVDLARGIHDETPIGFHPMTVGDLRAAATFIDAGKGG